MSATPSILLAQNGTALILCTDSLDLTVKVIMLVLSLCVVTCFLSFVR